MALVVVFITAGFYKLMCALGNIVYLFNIGANNYTSNNVGRMLTFITLCGLFK